MTSAMIRIGIRTFNRFKEYPDLHRLLGAATMR